MTDVMKPQTHLDQLLPEGMQQEVMTGVSGTVIVEVLLVTNISNYY